MFASNEVSMLRIAPSYLKKEVPYLGNVDTMITAGDPYKLYFGASFTGPFSAMSGDLISESSNPVRMKYKSSPHLVFSLGDSDNEIPLLPRHVSIDVTESNRDFQFPTW